MSAKSVLEKARKLIANEESWTQGSYVLDAAGQRVRDNDVAAKKYPVLVALLVSGAKKDFLAAANLFREAAPCNSIVGFANHPGRTHKEILEVLDRAIKIAK